jgi:hypothetical protein
MAESYGPGCWPVALAMSVVVFVSTAALLIKRLLTSAKRMRKTLIIVMVCVVVRCCALYTLTRQEGDTNKVDRKNRRAFHFSMNVVSFSHLNLWAKK